MFFSLVRFKKILFILALIQPLIMISEILFVIITGIATYFFVKNLGKIRRNILLGKDIDRSDNKPERIKTMMRVAFGQSKDGVSGDTHQDGTGRWRHQVALFDDENILARTFRKVSLLVQ